MKRIRKLITLQFLTLFSVAASCIGCATPRDLQVRSIAFTDDNGQVRMRAGLENSIPQILLLSPEGKTLIRLSGGLDGGEAAICDERGTLRVSIRTTPDTSIRILDANSIKRAVIICAQNGGVAGILLDSPNDDSAVEIEHQANGSAKLLIRSKDGKILWSAPTK